MRSSATFRATSVSRPPDYGREERVLGGQARELRELQIGQPRGGDTLGGVARAEALSAALGAELPSRRSPPPVVAALTTPVPPFDELVAAAPAGAGLRDALDDGEIEAALARLDAAGKRPDAEMALDRWDWAIAGAAGLLAGIADLVLVGVPQNPLTRFGAEGGPLFEQRPHGVRAHPSGRDRRRVGEGLPGAVRLLHQPRAAPARPWALPAVAPVPNRRATTPCWAGSLACATCSPERSPQSAGMACSSSSRSRRVGANAFLAASSRRSGAWAATCCPMSPPLWDFPRP